MAGSDSSRLLRSHPVTEPIVPTSGKFFEIACDEKTDLQQFLNELYGYKNDLITKSYHRSRIALFHLLIDKLRRDGVLREFGKALDIGCNAGFYSKVISDFGFRNVWGIDINDTYIAKANAAFRSDTPGKIISFDTMDATAIPRTNTYDFILCTEVIEHTKNPDAVIESIIGMLAPNGVAVVSLPNCLSLGYLTPYIADLMRGREIDQELRDHLKYPSYKALKLFRRSGARIILTAGVNSLFSNLSLRLLYGMPFFPALNRANFWLSRRTPFKWLSQFFFFAITKDASAAPRR